MYEEFYGLKADPFRLSADHRFCFDHRSYARAKAYVQYALYRAEGFVMVTGRPGTGKTTLINDLLASLPDKEFVAGTLVSTQLGAEDLLLMTGYAFGLDFHTTQKALVLQRLMEFLNQQHRQGLRTLLIIDEAQDLAPSALEELRLLTNLQRNGEPLLQIALLGQEALRELVRGRAMEQVHQRLIAAWKLDPLEPEETIGYVRHRLERAGWQGDPSFEPGVLRIVHGFSQGVPRRINLICSRLMLHGFIGERHTLTVEDAVTVARDLHREELARPDYVPDEALAHTVGPGNPDTGDGVSVGGDSGDNLWSGIDHGLFRAAAPKAPEPAAAPVEPRAPEDTAPEEADDGPRMPPDPEQATPDPATGSPKPENRERVAAAQEQPSPSPVDAATPTPRTGHGFVPESTPVIPLKLRPRSPSTRAEGQAGSKDARAAETADSMMHIVPDKEEHWEQAGAMASGSGRRVTGKRRSRVLSWFMLMVLISVAVVVVLFLSRTAMQDSPMAGVSASVAAVEQWWDESSAVAWNALQSLRAEEEENAARDATAADAAREVGPLRESEASATSGRGLEGMRAGAEADDAAATPRTNPAPEVSSAESPTTDTMPGPAAGSVPSSAVSAERGLPGRSSTNQPAEGSTERPANVMSRGTMSSIPASPSAQTGGAGSAQAALPGTQRPAGAAEGAAPNGAPARDAPPTTVSSGAAEDAQEDAAALAVPPLSGRVFFGVNSTTVDPRFETLMSEIAAALAQADDAYAEIVGYTDAAGPTEYNRYLSNLRAEAVAQQLRARGVPGDRLRIEGQGPREPETGDEGFRAEDRVVEITIRDAPRD